MSKKRTRAEFESNTTNVSKKQSKKKKIENKLCHICNSQTHKYKCANCQITKYCSVPCYQKHQEQKCEKPKKKEINLEEPVSLREYVVQPSQFKKLENDSRIRQALTNAHLQKIIETIDAAKKPEQLLENLISKDEKFAEFVDYMLTVIGFREKKTDIEKMSNQFLSPEEKLQILLKDSFEKNSLL